ncbi:nucleotide disphospho-sugar-binding domain-containing protein [Amycolatopsis sp. H20-H5]|uniref:nucleotide disphospho-sugar-binding domain-containing protein n=1 Tax=Amycolatopsis sp. H20-H5 TaxID=3046309 RepID=UPI002DBBCA9F|nr:nucleotide disphospho-sugar-binding domain-containing protein [Amycolatopsis sp. H20-H5]MEC3975180.1 nucleotide disphospho-sugar-binding domain-containing protein [Amycolatopsis sp. H20-H5]
MRILFTSVALPGHLFPLVPLAWACRGLGHEVLVATTENFVPTVLRTGLPACSFGPAGGIRDLLAAESPGTAGHSAGRRSAHGRAFAGITRRNLPGMRRLADAWRPDVVVSERAEFTGPVVAAADGVARVELHWGVAPLVEYQDALPDVLRGHPLWTALGEELPPADLMVNPWPPSLRPAYSAGHQSVRHVPYNGDAHLPDWMLGGPRRPRICLTLGTVVPHLGTGGGFMLTLLRRLAGLGAEVVVAVDDEIAAGWPDLPAAVVHAGRLPMAQTLGACGVVINHGGQGTTLTALASGCPQVVLPQFDDQFDNADAVVKAGAGVRLLPEEVTPDSVARACAAVLGDATFRAGATAATEEIAAQPSPAEIATLVSTLR